MRTVYLYLPNFELAYSNRVLAGIVLMGDDTEE